MRYEKHIVIDLEFTPIPKSCASQRDVVKHEIIQIGAVMLDANYRKISTFSTYVKPEFAYSVKPSVTKLTGITDLDLVNAPSLEEAVDKLAGWIGMDGRIRIYSWSDTDYCQLKNECILKNVDFPKCMTRWMDFQKIYGRLIGSRKKMSLKNAVVSTNGQFFGAQAHTALYDAMAVAELLILTTEREDFAKRTKTIRELLAPPKPCSITIGELFGDRLARFLDRVGG